MIKNGICNQSGLLTERGRLVAISYLTLKFQCLILDIDLFHETINITKSIEESALDFYKIQGYLGCFSEAGVISILLSCIFYDQLVDILKKKDERLDESYLSFEYFPKDKRHELSNLIQYTNSDIIIKNYKKLLKNPFVLNIDSNLLIKIYEALGNDEITKISKIYFDNIHASLYGWPDLILVKNNMVKLIEVKRKDKLKRSQIITLDTLKKATNLDISVLKIK